jgi:hypothetical protein
LGIRALIGLETSQVHKEKEEEEEEEEEEEGD